MKKSRLLICLSLLLAFCCLLSACNNGNGDATTVPETPESTTVTTKRPVASIITQATTAPEPKPEDMPDDEKLLIQGVNISSYTIIYGDSPLNDKAGSLTGKTIGEDLAPYLQGENKEMDYDYQTAVRLQQLIKDYYGYEIPIKKDTDVKDSSRYEILVGYTNRLGSIRTQMAIDDILDCYNLGPNTYKSNCETQYIICGGSYSATWRAVDEIETFFEANKNEASVDLSDLVANKKYYDFTVIACIGDSITRGSQALPQLPHYGNVNNVTEDWGSAATTTYFEQYLSYPATLQRELWKDCIVYNFGRGASTARNYTGNENNYYATSTQFKNCLKVSNGDVDFDVVFLMHGTNDAGRNNGAATWDDANKADFLKEIKYQMDEILKGSPDATFVMNNAPHRCDGHSVNANDAAIRQIQKETATNLKAAGYDVYHYDMEAYTIENLRSADACGTDSNAELKAHEGYYNIYYATNGIDLIANDRTHPNYRGYGKIAEGLADVVDYLVNGAEAPKYMINIG